MEVGRYEIVGLFEGNDDNVGNDEGNCEDEAVGTGDTEGKEEGHESPNSIDVSIEPKSLPAITSLSL